MKTRRIIIKPHSPYAAYFKDATMHTKALRNTANFYIRNTMTGLLKSPEERSHNETEVLHFVFTGIQKANAAVHEKFSAATRKAAASEKSALSRHVMMIFAAQKADGYRPIPYPTKERRFLSYRQLDAVLKCSGNQDYYSLPAQVNQQALKKTCQSWKGYFKALEDWKACPEKYKAKPRIPGYIREPASTAHFTAQVIKAQAAGGELKLRFPNSSLVLCAGAGIAPDDVVKVEVRPVYGCYQVLLTYQAANTLLEVPKHPKRILGIDIGVSNFFTCAGNYGDIPYIVDGKGIKSLNQWYNKEHARLISAVTAGSDSTNSEKHSKRLDTLSRKRDNQLRDYYYKAAHYIARRCKAQNVDLIVIGYNPSMKDMCDMKSANNQNLKTIAHKHAAEILMMVAQEYGIASVLYEESYTSKSSFLDGDPVPTYGENTKKQGKTVTFSGTRVKRGLYRSKNGTLINADVNGACNIIRKAYPKAFADITDFTYLTSKVERITRDTLCGIHVSKKNKSSSRKHKMTTTRRENRNQHRYKKRAYEKVFLGMSTKKRRTEIEKAAIEAAKQKKAAMKAAS